jgi:hypothetical protein
LYCSSVAGTWLFNGRRWLDSKDFEDFKTLKQVSPSRSPWLSSTDFPDELFPFLAIPFLAIS